jgi:hypothetical protein
MSEFAHFEGDPHPKRPRCPSCKHPTERHFDPETGQAAVCNSVLTGNPSCGCGCRYYVEEKAVEPKHTTTGVELIDRERWRQIKKEGFTPGHDKEHIAGDLADAAVCYAATENVYKMRKGGGTVKFEDLWPWPDGDKRRKEGDGAPSYAPGPPGERIRNLVKGGSLIAAELDRLLREHPKELAEQMRLSSAD